MQHRHDDDQRAVEPVGDVDRFDLSSRDRAEEYDRESDPGGRDRQVERPFELGVLLAGIPSGKDRDGAEDEGGLPGIEHGPGKSWCEQPDVRRALHAVERGRDQRGHAESEEHERRVRSAQPAERQCGKAEIDRRPDKLRGDIHARRHAEQCPENGAVRERRHDAVFVMRHFRYRSAARCRCPRLQP